ncbi:hypothetical protein AB4391_01290 [Vibrio lentus]|uniref:DUF1640 domain-containing protein n=1 Tax=Vibrio lentus TaxID=136468 RepID=A0A2N7KP31_9VIBR|nr:hypothetical protein [Vibrio lentus]PMM78459.1 hypothetical protein BCT49_00170 [Vibrio lentus]
MDNHSADNITQKDLLKLLFDQAQHNATREELNALEGRLNHQMESMKQEMSGRFNQVDEKTDKLDVRIDKLCEKVDNIEAKFDKKFDRMNWLLVTSLVGVCATLALQILK